MILTAQYRTHGFLLAFLLAGVLLLAVNPLRESETICIFRNLTGVACPSCGTGHGVQHLMQGNPQAAWHSNPFSYIAFPGIIFLATLITTDLVFRKNRLQQFFLFLKSRLILSNPLTWILIALVLLNWYFTILKY